MQPDMMNNEYLDQAEQALNSGDARAAAIHLNKVLKTDFLNDRAWKLLYRMKGEGKNFSEFQLDFVTRFYPNELQRLKNPITEELNEPADVVEEQPALPVVDEPNLPIPATVERPAKPTFAGQPRFSEIKRPQPAVIATKPEAPKKKISLQVVVISAFLVVLCICFFAGLWFIFNSAGLSGLMNGLK